VGRNIAEECEREVVAHQSAEEDTRWRFLSRRYGKGEKMALKSSNRWKRKREENTTFCEKRGINPWAKRGGACATAHAEKTSREHGSDLHLRDEESRATMTRRSIPDA